MTVNLIVILGTTASGKTKLAAHLARDLKAEIISADSRQVYRGMDIGTGKDLADYVVDGVPVPRHLIDIVEPDYEFSVFDYQCLFYQCFSEITARSVLPVMVGGTGLYIDAVLRGYRMLPVAEDCRLRAELEQEETAVLIKRLMALHPVLHNTTDISDRRRIIRAIEIAEHSRINGTENEFAAPSINPLVIGIRWERDVIRRRITNRLRERLEAGMIEEVKNLHDGGISWGKMNEFGLEYRYVGLFLQGEINYEEMFRILETRIHQFAKRQETWFRRMERQGAMIHWLENPEYGKLKVLVEGLLR
jgi:tRNA dimethylallyltransferase